MVSNRPEHFHIWRMAKGGRIFYFVRRAFRSQQGAAQWAARREPDKARYMVRRCHEERCSTNPD